jgi:hypothetical protein
MDYIQKSVCEWGNIQVLIVIAESKSNIQIYVDIM